MLKKGTLVGCSKSYTLLVLVVAPSLSKNLSFLPLGRVVVELLLVFEKSLITEVQGLDDPSRTKLFVE